MNTDSCEFAVSEIVGEMMMITIVLILVAIFAANVGNLLPPPRDPTVTIVVEGEGGSIPNHMNVILYHKGGDWIKESDLTVIISWGDKMRRFRSVDGSFQMQPEKSVFDLGSRITISGIPTDNATVSLVTPRKVIFSGPVKKNE